jgi:hypothetical protein
MEMRNNMDESLIIEIWDTFKDYIPEKNRGTAADQFVDYLLGKDIEAEDLEGFLGYDPHLDDAINSVIDHDEKSEDDEDEDYSFDDEDY